VTVAATEARDGELVFLHWNVHSWRDESGRPNVAAVAGLIAGHDPDVVSLVEVNEPWAAPAALTEVAGGHTWVFSPSVELGQGTPARGYGNALLCRPRLLAVQQWRLTWPQTVYDGTEPSETRSLALARISLPAAAVWVGSTHLPSSDPQARAAALHRLLEVTQHLDEPWVICGDFNAPPQDWLEPGQPVVVGPSPALPTCPASSPRVAIDYAIASPGVSLDARPLNVTGSDHLPVLVRCQFPAS
jgi:endonuclease/exonuclease/phosphatase family metal-dependent hydrolase